MASRTSRPGDATATGKTRVLSGLQPSGRPHLGNFFGAIEQYVQLQDEHPGETFLFIANYHALTSVQNAAQLRADTLGVALDYLALGIDPAKATLFRQSDVPEVTELTWLLATVTGVGLLEKGHSYKDKIAKGIPASAGLLYYPVLMAADIVVYRSTLVPVGEDQIQHIEFARDMAGSFNATYGAGETILPLPTYRLSAGKKIPGTDGEKMSKSYGNTIGIFDEGKDLQKKVMGIKTASIPLGQPIEPEGETVFTLYSLLATEEERADMGTRYREGKIGFGQAKKELLAKLDARFAPARARRKELEGDPAYVERVLREAGERARAEARATLDLCRRACGLD